MSWSHNFDGPALEVAAKIEKEAQGVQEYIGKAASQYPEYRTGFESERALHARATSLLVVACHESNGHHVVVRSSGHYDGTHNHVRIEFDAVSAPVVEPEPVTDTPVDPPDPDTPIDPQP